MSDPLRAALAQSLGPSFVLGHELRGGMSRIFVATDTALGRQVVVKTLGDAALDGRQALRFRQEVLVAASLQHPNIVPVLNAGTTADGTPYFTMPFVQGSTLRQRLADGPLPPAEVAALMRDVARALGAAHRRGVVHRDIKPENIFIADGVAMVSDFGVAKAIDAAGATTTGVAVGTPAYMAPEQAVAEPNVGPRADLYALGMVGWEMLTGRHPFADRPAMAMVVANLTEPVPALETVRPEVPDQLARLIQAMVEKEPAHRPVDADAVVASCAALIAAQGRDAGSGGARPPATAAAGQAAPTASGVAWRRWAIWGGATVGLLALGTVLVAQWRSFASPRNELSATTADVIDWPTARWLAPISAVRVAPDDSVALTTLERAAVRVRAVTVEPSPAASAPDSVTVSARTSAGTLVFQRPGGPSLAALPLSLPPDELESRCAGLLAILSSEVMAEWALPRGLPPRVELVERFLSLERIRLLREGLPSPELMALYVDYDRFVADAPDWAAPMLLIASRVLGWPARESYVNGVQARRAELTDVEQMLIDLFHTRLRGDMGGQLAVLRDLVRTTRFAEFGRAYAGVLGDSRQLAEASAVLWSVGPGPGREHIPFWTSLVNVEHLRGAHERSLEAAELGVRESGLRLSVRWRKLRALAALRRTAELRAGVADLASIPRDPHFSIGWLLTTLGDELHVHGDSVTAVAFHTAAMQWFDALRPGDRTLATELERAQLESRRGDHRAAALRVDSLRRVSAEPDLLTMRALLAARARDFDAADSLLAVRYRLPTPSRTSRDIVERGVRLATGALPGDSTIVAARISALRDDVPTAAATLRRALEGMGWRRWGDVVHFDPDFARIRAHADYRAALGAP